MSVVKPIAIEALRRRCDPKRLGFQTTDEIEPVDVLVAQERARKALAFGTAIDRPGYNLFVIGSQGFGRHKATRQFLQEKAIGETPPDEWVYVNNFRAKRNPKALRLPHNTALPFQKAMEALIEDLEIAIPSLFESDDYKTRMRVLAEDSQHEQEEAFEALRAKTEAEGIAILKTPMGFALAPVKNGEVIKPEVFRALEKSEQERIETVIEALQKDLEETLQKMPFIEKERRNKVRELNQEMASAAIGASIAEVAASFQAVEPILDYLKAAEADMIDNIVLFMKEEQQPNLMALMGRSNPEQGAAKFRRYGVNVIVADREGEGAPVIFEDHPTLGNVLGRIEHMSQMGTLFTDFMLIKPGALHKANGGYLVVDARRLLTEPFVWEAIKRTLRSGSIRIESGAEHLGLSTTVSLDPEPIPLHVKVILIGERRLYDLLVHFDPDFGDLFKVEADFDDRWERTEDNEGQTARLFSSIIRSENLLPLSAEGAALLIEEAARDAQDAERLSLRTEELCDLLSEADYWARQDERRVVSADDMDCAIKERIQRKDRIRERMYEAIERETMLIDTEGSIVGQVNGLAVLGIGGFAFGKPSRITARVRMGTGKLIDIEREVKLGGPLHSKGVMILSSYLNGNFSLDQPISLWASLVFEQSYGGVDGDSASSTELYTLLSALSDVPIKQSLAVTGSVNQLGQVQAIGGVNEKIEGFFDICKARGLTGDQGVLIPASNVKHLMLRQDVVDAAADGRFNVYPVSTINEGIELLTGRAAGERDADGRYPAESINALVEEKLETFATRRRFFASDGEDKKDE